MFIPQGRSFELPQICLLAEDHEFLSDLVCASPRATRGIELLWQELQRAVILEPGEAPDDLIRLSSLVRFTEAPRDAQRAAQIVGPFEAADRSRISVVTPVGAALIGLKAGDSFPWISRAGELRVLRVDGVAADPAEARRRRIAAAAARRQELNRLLSIS